MRYNTVMRVCSASEKSSLRFSFQAKTGAIDMGAFMANFKGQKAARLHGKGQIDEARKLYAEAYSAGMNDPPAPAGLLRAADSR